MIPQRLGYLAGGERPCRARSCRCDESGRSALGPPRPPATRDAGRRGAGLAPRTGTIGFGRGVLTTTAALGQPPGSDGPTQHPAPDERPAALGHPGLLRLHRHPHARTGRLGRRRRAVRALLRGRTDLHAEPRLHADRPAARRARRVRHSRHPARRPGAGAGAPRPPRLPDRPGRQAARVPGARWSASGAIRTTASSATSGASIRRCTSTHRSTRTRRGCANIIPGFWTGCSPGHRIIIPRRRTSTPGRRSAPSPSWRSATRRGRSSST